MTSSAAVAHGPVRDQILITLYWYWEHRASCSIASQKVNLKCDNINFNCEEFFEVSSLLYLSEFSPVVKLYYDLQNLRFWQRCWGVVGWSSCQCFGGSIHSSKSWNHFDPSKRWEPFAQQHRITSWKLWIVNCQLYLNILCLLSGKREVVWGWKMRFLSDGLCAVV